MFSASVIAVADEVLLADVEDQLRLKWCRKLHSIGWFMLHPSIVCNNLEVEAEDVEQQNFTCKMGSVGPWHSVITIAGIAKASGVKFTAFLSRESQEILVEELGSDLWDPGGHSYATSTHPSIFFKIWDPGGSPLFFSIIIFC